MFFFSKIKNTIQHNHSGFSLVELMVTIGIVTLVTGVVLIRYSSFNSVVILKSQAYEMGLDIREAQVFGVSVGGSTGQFREAYGMYINLSTPNIYTLFQDAPGSGTDLVYDAGEEVGEVYVIDPRFTILEICTTFAATYDCAGATEASIAFKRPDFDARMTTNGEPNPQQIEIVIAAVEDPSVRRTVVVYASGQISIQ